MKRLMCLFGAGVVTVAVLVSAPAFAQGSSVTTCTSGLAPGSYQRVVVPAGAACLSDGPVTITVGVYIGPGATILLGSDEGTSPTGTISGGVHATYPASVQIHLATINGGLDVHGGSGRSEGRSTSPGTRSRTTASTTAPETRPHHRSAIPRGCTTT